MVIEIRSQPAVGEAAGARAFAALLARQPRWGGGALQRFLSGLYGPRPSRPENPVNFSYVCQGLDAIGASRIQHNACALLGEMPGGRFAQPAARALDDRDLSFDVIAHELDTCLS
jgi:hypothetical protein